MKFATKAIHAGQEADPKTGAVNTPVYFTSTYKQDGVGKLRNGFEYSRTGNPSRQSLEQTIAAIENGKYGLCFSSGSAATTAVLNLLQPGDEVLSTIDIYGGTYRLFKNVYEKYGIQFRALNSSDAIEIINHVSGNTKMIWLESPTNPLLNVIDIKYIADNIHEDILLVIDNTFASPYFQTPLLLGADLVVHSTTKYLGGHSDIIGGALITNNEQLYNECKFYQNAAGAVPGPMDCYLVQRGIKTLEIRMKKHEENALQTARFLDEHHKVEKVYYPGLKNHKNHAVALKQMSGFSGIVSFLIKDGKNNCDKFFAGIKIFTLAESLGGVESLVCHPYSMTHGSIPDEEKLSIGITKNLIRLSVGLENIQDLIDDLDNALK